jgi:hypothetical protein
MNQYSGDLNNVSSLPRWFGRVVSSASWQDNIEAAHLDPKDQKGWGYRYRVRYFGLHSANTQDLPDDQLPMANVVMPVTSGSGLGGFIDTPALSAGCVVTGFFLDGMAGQEPYIDGVMINSNNEVPKEQPKDATGGLQLSNNTYTGTSPQTAAYVPDSFIAIKKIERPSFASTQYKVVSSTPYTIDELRQRTASREAAGPQVGETVTDVDTITAINEERYINETGTLPG